MSTLASLLQELHLDRTAWIEANECAYPDRRHDVAYAQVIKWLCQIYQLCFYSLPTTAAEGETQISSFFKLYFADWKSSYFMLHHQLILVQTGLSLDMDKEGHKQHSICTWGVYMQQSEQKMRRKDGKINIY